MSDFTKSRISMSDSWKTPKKLYDELDEEFHFNYDPCPLNEMPEFGDSGLLIEWGDRSFMNPPYSNPEPWVRRAYEQSLKGKLVVGLLRCDTSTEWFHKWVLGKAEIRFIKGRVCFNGKPAPFASIIAIWRG